MIPSNIKFRLDNIQKGVVFISKRQFEEKAAELAGKYENRRAGKPEPVRGGKGQDTDGEPGVAQKSYSIETNIRKRSDFALVSMCRDLVVEQYLQGGRYTFRRIGVLINPFRFAPKSVVLLFCTRIPVRVGIEMRSGSGHVHYRDETEAERCHRISVTGLEKGRNEITLSLLDENGLVLKKRTIHVTYRNSPNMEENPIVRTENNAPCAYDRILITGGDLNPFIFQPDGSLFHYLKFARFTTGNYGVYSFRRNWFLWPVREVGAPSFGNPHSPLLYEMDFMGRISRTWHVRDGLHHFVCELPNGNLAAFSSSNERYGAEMPEGHTEDTILELERTTGKIVRRIYLKDLLGEEHADMVDWVHGNSMEYDPEEDSMLICMRNIHSVLKFNWTTLEVQWLLSLPSFWKGTEIESKVLTPVGEVDYSFQAHAAYEIREFRGRDNGYRFYMVYDNHRLNRRPLEGQAEDGHSYINVYGVDEKLGLVRQIRHHQVDMSIVRSNARYEDATGHLFNMAGCMTRDHTKERGKVEEYDYESGRLLNRWTIRNDFFSGYGFTWRSDDYKAPLGLTADYAYAIGEADRLVPVEGSFELTEERIDERYFKKPVLEEEYLYFRTRDHSITALVLYGKKYCYERDYSDTWQTVKIHMDQPYSCVVSLKGLRPDTYQVRVLWEGKLYTTEYEIAIG